MSGYSSHGSVAAVGRFRTHGSAEAGRGWCVWLVCGWGRCSDYHGRRNPAFSLQPSREREEGNISNRAMNQWYSYSYYTPPLLLSPLPRSSLAQRGRRGPEGMLCLSKRRRESRISIDIVGSGATDRWETTSRRQTAGGCDVMRLALPHLHPHLPQR